MERRWFEFSETLAGPKPSCQRNVASIKTGFRQIEQGVANTQGLFNRCARDVRGYHRSMISEQRQPVNQAEQTETQPEQLHGQRQTLPGRRRAQ